MSVDTHPVLKPTTWKHSSSAPLLLLSMKRIRIHEYKYNVFHKFHTALYLHFAIKENVFLFYYRSHILQPEFFAVCNQLLLEASKHTWIHKWFLLCPGSWGADSKYKQILLNKSSWREQGCCNSYFIRAFDCGSVSVSCLQAGASSVNTALWIIYFSFHFVGWQAVIGFFSAGFSLLGALRSYRIACFYFHISRTKDSCEVWG